MTTCEACGEPCTATVLDDSFDHEFGTETILSAGSSCCEADAVDSDGHTITYADLRREAAEARAEREYEDRQDWEDRP